MNKRLVPSALALMLGACSLAPTYQVPDSAPAPQSFKESQGWKTAVPADSVSRGAWWEQFQDPVLNALEAKVGAANQDIKAALARLDQAQAAVGVARSYYFPTATANASSVNQRVSTKKPFYFAAFDPKYQDNLLGLNVSYEVDVWGRIRNAVAA
ncbi:MAG: TolC family protein, partial [Betaproteobacteria bacterium]|nr:TolC family protein [Betaproteobacteria bacterium]